MPVLPTIQSLEVLLAWSEAVEKKHGWVRLEPVEVPALGDVTPEALQASITELASLGLCVRAAHGELVYLTRDGAKLAKVTRHLRSQGAGLEELTPDTIARPLMRFPFGIADANGATGSDERQLAARAS